MRFFDPDEFDRDDQDAINALASDGLTGRQVLAINNILKAGGHTPTTNEEFKDLVQGIVDVRAAQGQGNAFKVASVGQAGKVLLSSVSAERAERNRANRERQEGEPLSERQENRLNQLVAWLSTVQVTEAHADALKRVREQVEAVALSLTPTKAQASDAISLSLRFANIVGLEAPTSVNAPSPEGDTITTVDQPESDEADDESAF